DRVERSTPFALCYLDFDNFKPFADTFGFPVADQAIRRFGSAIRKVLEDDDRRATPEFLGHIGGDDFIVICEPERAQEIARECSRILQEVVGELVGAQAMQAGSFEGPARDGTVRSFPIATLSAAILVVRPARWVSVQHAGALAADLKRRAKQR